MPILGNGQSSCRFWSDRRLGGSVVAKLSTDILAKVPSRRGEIRTVAQGLLNGAWIDNILIELSLLGL